MCDSTISVSCPADFTSYCPASAFCDEDIRPQKKRRHRSSVRSRVALFSRKAKGPRQGISSQPRIKPLGEDSCASEKTSLYSNSCSEHELEASPLEWTSESTTEDEEGATTQDSSWLHEQPSSYVSVEELHALRGCVTRGRALFSPSPYSERFSELSKVGIVYPQTDLSSTDPNTNDKLFVPQTELIPVPEHANELYHARQGSFEYDHLEAFHPDQTHESSDSRNSFSDCLPDQQPALVDSACSVSVQFGSTGYECKAVCETDDLPAKCSPSLSQVTQEMVNPQNEPVSAAAVTNVAKSTESGDTEVHLLSCGKCDGVAWLPLSQSTPGRLNSPNLRFGRRASSGVCHCPSCCPCGSFQRKITFLQQASKRQLSHCHLPVTVSHLPKLEPRDRCNSWPRHKICPLAQYGSDAKLTQKQPSVQVQMHKFPAGSQTLMHSSYPRSSPRHKIGSVRNFDSSEAVDYQDASCQQIPHVESSVSLKSMNSPRIFRSGSNSSSCCERHVGYVKGVDGKVYKERVDLLLAWFAEFSDQQRNMMLTRLLEKCNCAQMHFLSVQMEPILHDGCPHNCQDLLSWLPQNVTFHILSFLDPVSLCRATQVSRSWFYMANVPNLWMTLCRMTKWQLSPIGEAKHFKTFTLPDGTMQWKQMFAERFRLRRNWLNGYCNVRTFEGHTQGISCIQFDDTRIVSGSWDKTIKVWNRRTNTAWAALTLAGHSGTVRCLHLHGNRLVSGSSDRTIKVWDLATDKVGWVGATCRATMVGHMHTVRCLQADDEKVISGSYDLTLKVWDIKTGNCNRTLRGHTDAVLCVQFDKEKVVSGSKDTTIKVWTLPNGQCHLTLHGHQAAVTCLQFNDTRIISGALDRLIKIWNIISGQCLRTMDWIRSEGHTGVVRHLQADSWKIVSAADDKTLKVWSVHTGDRLLTLKSHSDGVTCLQFNDEVIVSGSYDKTVKLWDFSAC